VSVCAAEIMRRCDRCGNQRPKADPADIPALIGLRLANASAHVALDAATYRIPRRSDVTRYFSDVLADGSRRNVILVAEAGDGRVIGMVELLRSSDPPAHQILRPEPTAQIHTVVLPGTRSQGVGAALLAAAEKWAAGEGITYLSAGIHYRNAGAVRFYGEERLYGRGRLTRQTPQLTSVRRGSTQTARGQTRATSRTPYGLHPLTGQTLPVGGLVGHRVWCRQYRIVGAPGPHRATASSARP
jgi:GNAT superfamily N-acetyltransferase